MQKKKKLKLRTLGYGFTDAVALSDSYRESIEMMPSLLNYTHLLKGKAPFILD